MTGNGRDAVHMANIGLAPRPETTYNLEVWNLIETHVPQTRNHDIERRLI